MTDDFTKLPMMAILLDNNHHVIDEGMHCVCLYRFIEPYSCLVGPRRYPEQWICLFLCLTLTIIIIIIIGQLGMIWPDDLRMNE